MKTRRRLRDKGLVALTAFCIEAFAAPSQAASVADFYRGKTIELVIGFAPGGLYDLYGRLIAQYIGNHIPGKPIAIPRNMPGGSGRVAAGYIYTAAPQDGTELGTVAQSLPLEQVLGREALQFDLMKMKYIGNPVLENDVIVAWAASGVATLADVRAREVTMGSTGAPSSYYTEAANALLGTKFKLIYGYQGGADINLAMERGEVEGRGSSAWNEWTSSRADWVRDKKIKILAQIGLSRSPDLPDVPLLLDEAKNDRDRDVLKLLSSQTLVGKQLFMGPRVPDDRVAAVRAAFEETMKDPAFLAQIAKQKFDLSPVSGLQLQDTVRSMLEMPPSVTDRLKQILN